MQGKEITIEYHKNRMWRLTSGFPGTVHGHLHTLGVDGDERRGAADEDAQVETLAAAAPTNKPEIVELGHVVLHHLRVVPQLPAKVLIVPDSQVDHRAVLDVTQCDHFESRRKGLVRSPVAWKSCAQNIRGTLK